MSHLEFKRATLAEAGSEFQKQITAASVTVRIPVVCMMRARG